MSLHINGDLAVPPSPTSFRQSKFETDADNQGQEAPPKNEPQHRKDYLDRIKADSLAFASHTSLAVVLYAALWLKLGSTASPPDGPWFCLAVLWLGSIFGGFVAKALRLPPLLGMMMAGVIITNARVNPAGGIPDGWSETIRASGLAIILLKSGFELDLTALRREGAVALRLTCLPGMAEAMATGLASTLIFGMPPTLGFSLGFIIGAVSPAAVVVGMLELQKRGYGVAKGIPSLVVAAASFDDVIAISGFSIFIGIALKADGGGGAVWLEGPLSVVIGLAGGIFGGLVISMTKLWNYPWKRTAITLGLSLVFMFGAKRCGFPGSGAMAAIVMGMVGGVCWEKGYPKALAKGPKSKYIREVERDVTVLWWSVSEPLLFGVIGSALDFATIPDGTVSRSLLIVILGVFVRVPAAFYATGSKDLTVSERGFVALAWIPKATVQAALASLPLSLIKDTMQGRSDYEEYVSWGNQVLSTAVLSIMVTAPLGLLFIQYAGPKLLTRDIDPKQGSKDKIVEKLCSSSVDESLSQLDSLIQRIGLQSESVECTYAIAEARKVLWRCKAKLEEERDMNKVDAL